VNITHKSLTVSAEAGGKAGEGRNRLTDRSLLNPDVRKRK
jgi:hypothetical protein